MITQVNPKNLQIVCNSHSTLESLNNSPWANMHSTVIYNPSGLAQKPRTHHQIKTIGIVSMLAPWKGIHEVVLWAKLYEKELQKLGVEKIKFFGADIYFTTGHHTGYSKQLSSLADKLLPGLIAFEGNMEPADIFNNIDCLIHYSLEAEPFGRVIIEAFHHGVPVISTGLGGAAELIEDGISGIVNFKYDQHGLFEAIEKLVTDEDFRKDIIENAYLKSIEIEKNIKAEMQHILQDVAI